MPAQTVPLAYSIKDFCRAIGISTRTFYNLRQNGEAPPITRIGGRVLVRHETANIWLEEREIES
jgi:predicted DNA-binding transcriptional regulator AlpA